MKKQTLEIEVPDHMNAVWKDGEVVFEDIEPQLPNTWEEFCKNSNISEKEYFISDYYGVSKVHRIRIYQVPRDPKRDANILPSKDAAEQHLALMKLHQLRDCYRQGWEPNLCEPKSIFAILYIKYRYTVRNTSASEFLTFQSKEIASKFLHNFRALIEQAGDLI